MTLNQVLDRIKIIATAHKQVRSYTFEGLATDSEDEHTRKYAAVELLLKPGVISLADKRTRFDFTMFVLDLVNVSANAKTNEQDVVSDMTSVAQDLYAQLNNPNYDDWLIGSEADATFLFENGNDQTAGIAMDFSVFVPYVANICEVPSETITITPTDDDMGKPTYFVTYRGLGTEGLTLDTAATGSTLNVLTGKKVLGVLREPFTLHPVSNLPDQAEYTWNGTLIGLGVVVNLGERFLVTYRNY